MTLALITITIAAYMVFMIAIGVRLSRQNQSSDDFYLGGRKLGPLVTAMSAEASDMSSWLLMGLPGVALAGLVGMNGSFAEAFWTAAGLALGTYLNWLIVAKPLRVYSEKLNASTIPDFFANRFGDKGVLLVVSAIIIVVFFVPYTASGFASVGKLFNSLFGVDYHVAMIAGALVIALYTSLGGFLAASTTDFYQSIIMSIALVVILWYGISTCDGVGTIINNTEVVPGYFRLNGPDGSYTPLTIASCFAWGLGYCGMPHILLRFMAIKDDRKLALSRRVASVWVVISMSLAVFIGIIGYSFAKGQGLIDSPDFDPERIIVYISQTFAEINPLFAVIAGLILSGILAAIMSTADSQMLAASSSVSENLFKRFFLKDMPKKKELAIARITVVAIAAVSVIFAWNPDSSVFRIVSFAWAGFGASFGPLMLCSLFWRRTNKTGAIAGVLAGGIMVFVWKFGISRLGGIFAIYELLPAFIFGLAVIIIVSLLTKAPSDEVTSKYDEVRAILKEKK